MHQASFILFFVWLAAMILACWAVEVARMFARRMAKEAQRGDSSTVITAGHAAVILPIKGVAADTEDNLRALLAQDYPNFRLLFAVESEDDPVVPLLRRVAADTSRPPISIVIAGIATTRGQKIHNQLAAIEQTSDEDEFLVFMDADAQPKPHWLGTLVKPFSEAEDVGATTGFRFYVPTGDGTILSLASAMASVLNASVAALLGPGWRNIAWGGSMAIRRRDFFGFGIDQAWHNALSDDYVLSWCVKKKARRRIQFLQTCLVPSSADFTWATFWEFAIRQYKITRICAPLIWLTAVGAPLLYLAALAYTLVFYTISLVQQRPDHPLLMFAVLYAANVVRGHFLLQGAQAALPRYRKQLQAAKVWYTLGYPLSFLINLIALLRSGFGHTLNWRGTAYTMHNRLKTTVHRPAVRKAAALPEPVNT